ncbi:AraC family transcriptional regulator [Reinekea thalattae]|uniref:AraC family transcriptional regulator n=1 Tax=Reinekea thalattae TaxID=2593301 RepID=A0A5C8Z8F3_9GAMM|nr:AraC family transcriptional regulator [Reinekea thalattae]TXR53947.1 AraC family transcriptional regulator [Reinekea thalattae]
MSRQQGNKHQVLKQQIAQWLEEHAVDEGLIETGIQGVQLFRVTDAVRCAPAVYEPSVTVILSGTKEAILDGQRHLYSSDQYFCCTMPTPVEAGAPDASPDHPLLGVYISLDTRLMSELSLEMDNAAATIRRPSASVIAQSVVASDWDMGFADALYRLLLLDNDTDKAVLGSSRLRELYYAILKGASGASVKQAFGVGNEIARAINYLSSHLDESVSIDRIAAQVGMSRAVFHRKFKQATRLSPIQFVKSMRLNSAAIKIADGMNVSSAAMDVGYVSSSQFSREFKRMYGQSPKQWIRDYSAQSA